MWEDALESYHAKTPRSREAFERAEKTFAGGVSHNVRHFEPYPFVTTKAQGKYIWDLDGNRYCDYWMGHTALILGHSPPPVVNALRKQVEEGTQYGTANLAAVELGEKVAQCVPAAEMTRLCCSGTEATMYAMRLARAYTGRRVIIKMEGGWHGFNSVLQKAVTPPFEEAESAGMLEGEQDYVKAAPFNAIDEVLKVIRESREDLAGLLMEPVLGAGGCIPAERGFIQVVREETEKLGATLIFDEVITGFRIALGGAQEFYGVEPDIITFGKIMGGGLPVGAVSGRREIMQLASPTPKTPKNQRCRIGGGTFSANPLTTAAGLATLTFLQSNRKDVYSRLNEMGAMAREGVDAAFQDSGLMVRSTGVGSLFLTHFLRLGQGGIKSARDAFGADSAAQERFHLALMAKHGVFFLPGHIGAVSNAHTKEDIQGMVEAAERLAEEAGRGSSPR